jgi:cytochrome c oxidase cbb3-type subunit 3
VSRATRATRPTRDRCLPVTLSPGHLVTLSLLVLVAGCDLPGKPDPADRPVPANQVKDFQTLYATHCAGCHGSDGQLGPAPPLNDPIFLAIVPDAELLFVIAESRAVTATQKSLMPAFSQEHGGQLTKAQVKVLAQGIKKRWLGQIDPTEQLPPYLAPTAKGNKDEGMRVFARACADCHGTNGKGGMAGAINDPAFLALISDQALRRIIITGRPDLGMPAYNDKHGRMPDFRPLTNAEIDNLVALLGHWRQGPSASGE